jgi:hypothetical protein
MYPVFLLLASAATRLSANAAGIRTFMLRDE